MTIVDQDWLAPASLHAAAAAQRGIAAAVETEDRLDSIGLVAGADTSNKWRDSRGPIHAAIAPLRLAAGARRDLFASSAHAHEPLPPGTATLIPQMPYIPGYLGFREVPALIAAWEALAEKPDLLFVDGHGRAHPRRCGIASHLGVLLDMPTIGIAKSLLCGRVEREVGPVPGDRAPIIDSGEVVGMALRTSARGGPVFVGIGHRVSLETAVEWTLRLSDGRRLPLPIRLAHDAANAVRRAAAALL